MFSLIARVVVRELGGDRNAQLIAALCGSVIGISMGLPDFCGLDGPLDTAASSFADGGLDISIGDLPRHHHG